MKNRQSLDDYLENSFIEAKSAPKNKRVSLDDHLEEQFLKDNAVQPSIQNSTPTATKLVQQLNTSEAPKQLSDSALLEDYNKRHEDGYFKRIANNFENRVNTASDSLVGPDNVGETALKAAAVPIGAFGDIIGEAPTSYLKYMANDQNHKGKFKGSLPQVIDTITSKMGANSEAFAKKNPRLASDLDAYITVVGGFLPFASKLAPKRLPASKVQFQPLVNATKGVFTKDLISSNPSKKISLADQGKEAMRELADKYNNRNLEKNAAYKEVEGLAQFPITIDNHRNILSKVNSVMADLNSKLERTPAESKILNGLKSLGSNAYKKIAKGELLTANDLIDVRTVLNEKINWKNFSKIGDSNLHDLRSAVNDAIKSEATLNLDFGGALTKADDLHVKLKTDFPMEDPQFKKFFNKNIQLDFINKDNSAAKGQPYNSKSVVENASSKFIPNLNKIDQGTLEALLRSLPTDMSEQLLRRALKISDGESGGKVKNLAKAAINLIPSVNLPVNLSGSTVPSKLRAISKDIQIGSKRAPLFASKSKAKSGSSPLFGEDKVKAYDPTKDNMQPYRPQEQLKLPNKDKALPSPNAKTTGFKVDSSGNITNRTLGDEVDAYNKSIKDKDLGIDKGTRKAGQQYNQYQENLIKQKAFDILENESATTKEGHYKTMESMPSDKLNQLVKDAYRQIMDVSRVTGESPNLTAMGYALSKAIKAELNIDRLHKENISQPKPLKYPKKLGNK